MTTPIPTDARLAVVVSHPAHLLTIVGILLRWRPHILILDETSRGPGAGQTELIREGLKLLGLDGKATFTGIDEDESYQLAIAQNFSSHLKISDLVYDWLEETKPTHVIGDAYEASNFQHDLGRLMLDDAVHRFRKSVAPLENLEFPLFAQREEGDSPGVYGTFLSGDFLEYQLTEAEASTKRRIVEQARHADGFVNRVAEEFPDLGREPYRIVPESRDYQKPPEGLSLYYDGRGREFVASGKYKTAISFEEHFLPLVSALKSRN